MKGSEMTYCNKEDYRIYEAARKNGQLGKMKVNGREESDQMWTLRVSRLTGLSREKIWCMKKNYGFFMELYPEISGYRCNPKKGEEKWVL
jgi:hypothetical protein